MNKKNLLELACIMDGIAENGAGLGVVYRQGAPGIGILEPADPEPDGDAALCEACLGGIAYLAFCVGAGADPAKMSRVRSILRAASDALELTSCEENIMFSGGAGHGLSAGDADSLACPDAAIAAQACRRLAAGESDVWIDIPDSDGAGGENEN